MDSQDPRHCSPQALSDLWDEHVKFEFATRNTEDTLATMVEDAYVNHVPVLTGGCGREELRAFYAKRFIPQMPPDLAMTPISRTIVSRRSATVRRKSRRATRSNWVKSKRSPTPPHDDGGSSTRPGCSGSASSRRSGT